MPTKRKRVERHLVAPISPAVIAHLETGAWPDEQDAFFELLSLSADALAAVWLANRDTIVSRWVQQHPGTRPLTWWAVDAPEPGRRRVDGIGDVFASGKLEYGIEQDWTTREQADLYNGRVPLAPGLVVPEWHEGAFKKVPVDPHHPPRFESQATYLDRHGLLTDDERRRLPADAFAPEPIAFTVQ